jgi:hypothetical protein
MKPSVPIVVAFALFSLPALASEPGNMMKITSSMHMQMAGMPAMAPMHYTQTVCTAAKHPDPRDTMRNGAQCRVTDYKKIGNTISYDVTCGPPMQMTGDGKFTLLPNAGTHGVMHMSGNAGGQSMQMDMTVDGTRVGSCDYTPRPAH